MPFTPPPAEQLFRLLSLVSSGDTLAFAELYLISKARLAASARRLTSCYGASDDVLQESYISIWRNAKNFDAKRSAPMTWMTAIVRNKAIDYARAERHRSHLSVEDLAGDVSEGCDLADRPDEVIERYENSRIINRGLSKLDLPQRQAIELAFFHELSHPEIAYVMMIPLGTAKTWIRRGCISLRATCKDLCPNYI